MACATVRTLLRRGASTLAHGRLATAAPGPTSIPEHVLNAMHTDTVNYAAVLQMGDQISEDLRALARTQHHVKVLCGNGHTGWQSALANVLDPGDKALLVDSRGFAHLWGVAAGSLGVELEVLQAPALHEPVEAEVVERRLKQDTAGRIKAVVAVHTESDFTVHHDIAALRAAMDAAQHPALLMLDSVATLGCAPVEMDLWGVDVMVSASQKGLMLPPGLAVLGISDRALQLRLRKGRVPMVSDWLCGMTAEPKGAWCPGTTVPWISPGTPPTHLLMGLQASLDTILRKQGLEATWERHQLFASAVWAAVDAWGAQGTIRCFVPQKRHRSPVVTLVKVDGVDVGELRRWTLEESNLLLPGAGLGFLMPPGAANFQEGFEGHDAFRIGHMGYSNPTMLLGTLATVDCGLKALGIPHGGGAVEAAAQVIAKRWAELRA